MSRSFKKSLAYSYANLKSSQKKDKQIGNRKMRRISKSLLKTDSLNEKEKLPKKLKHVLNTWEMKKDGTKHYMRFDERRWFNELPRSEQIKLLGK